VINVRLSKKTGEVVSIKEVRPDDELMLVTRNGIVNRQRVAEIRETGRRAQGVRLINLDEGDFVVDVTRVVSEEEEEEITEEGASAEAEGGDTSEEGASAEVDEST
jgi:DNA gyrase subunit A